MEPHRLLRVLKVLARLLKAATLLVTLALQVPLKDLLHQVHVGSPGPQEHLVVLRGAEHWGMFNSYHYDKHWRPFHYCNNHLK